MEQQLFKLASLARDAGRSLAAVEICKAASNRTCTSESCPEVECCESLKRYNELSAAVTSQIDSILKKVR